MTRPDAQLRAEMDRRITAAGGVVAWARQIGVSHTAVSLVRSGERPISEPIANACGYIVVTAYRRIAEGIH